MNKKEFIIRYYNRMKYYVLLSLIIFVSSMLLSYFYPQFFQSIMGPALQGMKDGVNRGEIVLKAIPLFVNNFNVAMNIYSNSLFMAVASVYLLCYNAILVGYTGASMNLGLFVTYTLPHGIFELSAIILSGAASFRLTHAIINIILAIRPYSDNRSEIFKEYTGKSLMMILDSALLMVIVAVLLVIAAVIEAHVTVSLGNYLMGL